MCTVCISHVKNIFMAIGVSLIVGQETIYTVTINAFQMEHPYVCLAGKVAIVLNQSVQVVVKITEFVRSLILAVVTLTFGRDLLVKNVFLIINVCMPRALLQRIVFVKRTGPALIAMSIRITVRVTILVRMEDVKTTLQKTIPVPVILAGLVISVTNFCVLPLVI